MAVIQWDESFSVKIVEIDKQHQKLFDMVNEIDAAQRQGKGKDIVGKIIDGLINYVSEHFKHEESFFDRYNYPDTKAHKLKHVDFVNKVLEFRSGFEKNKLGLSMDLMKFLCDWLHTHIKGSDLEYAPFLRQQGLK